MANDKEFVPGLFIYPPNDKAPDFVKGAISIEIPDLGKWLKEKHNAGETKIRLDIKSGKSGKWYAEVNTWKPSGNPSSPDQSGGAGPGKAAPDSGGMIDDDIPFAPFERGSVI